MNRVAAFFLAGCGVYAGLILVDFGSIGSRRPSFEANSLSAENIPGATANRKLADPMLGPTRRRPDAPASANGTAAPLHDVRLTGVVIGPNLREAIFAVTGADPLVLSEGDTLRGWRLDSIAPEKVVLSGPDGSMALAPKPDANLVRSPPPAAAGPGQFAPGLPAVPPPPIAVTPVTIVNLPPPAPVQTQSYPYYPAEYYNALYSQYFPSFGNYVYPFTYFAYAVPRRFGFGFGFHHHGFHHGGFHNVAFHGGGFGRRR